MRFPSDLCCGIQSLLLSLDTLISASATCLSQKVMLVELAAPVDSAMPQEDSVYQTFIRQHINLESQTGKWTQERNISQNIQSFSGHSFFSLQMIWNGHWCEHFRQEAQCQYFIFLSGAKSAQLACLKAF